MTTAGPSAAYTDARAVAAHIAFEAYETQQRLTPLVISTPTPTSYHLATTPLLEAGTYALSIMGFATGSAQGTDLAADAQIDGFSLGIILTESGVTGGGFLFSSTIEWVFSAAIHTVEVLFWQPTSPGFITGISSHVMWRRKK